MSDFVIVCFFSSRGGQNVPKFAQFCDLGCPGRIGGLLNWYWLTDRMDGWLVGMTLCRHLKIISLSATIGPAIEKQSKLKKRFWKKKCPIVFEHAGWRDLTEGWGVQKLFWQCPNRWDTFQKQKYRSCSKMPNCIWTCRQGRLLAAFTIQSFCFGAADALEMRGSITIHWGRWTLCMNRSEIPIDVSNQFLLDPL